MIKDHNSTHSAQFKTIVSCLTSKCYIIQKAICTFFFSAATGLKVPFPSKGYLLSIKPFTPISDQGRISLYNNDTILSKKVVRIKKNINWG